MAEQNLHSIPYTQVKSHADVLKEAVLTERNEGAKLKVCMVCIMVGKL